MKKVVTLLRKAILSLCFLLPTSVYAQTQDTAVKVVGNLKDVTTEQIETAKKLVDMIMEFFVKYSFQVLGGIIVIVIGLIIASYIAKLVGKLLEKKKVDVTVTKFIVGTVKLMIMTFAVIVAIGKFGIDIAPLIAGVSVAGFGLSFAMQGPLSNYAAGATLIFTKPFKVGDIIEVAGVMGEVLDMKLPRTELKEVDGNTVIIPNKHIIGEIIQNFSEHKLLDVKVGVSYSADVNKAIDIVKGVIAREDRIAKAPHVGISGFGDSSVDIYARVFCKQDDYWAVMFEVNKDIFDAFKEKGIEIPFPQRDVHIIEKK